LDTGCIVLAGGSGLRLGQNKALEIVGKRSLLERVLRRLSFLNSDILLVTTNELPYPWLSDYPRLRIVSDIYPGNGPLGGIYTGLKFTGSDYSLVVACDMPFLNQGLLRYMVGLSAGFDLVVPRVGELVEPLHSVYSKACLAPIECLMDQGSLGIRDLFSLVRVRYVEAEEIDMFDPGYLSFFNVNTKSDLAKARGLVGNEI
jgi:molybdopterin-guanine dinucleotide biosynthesis protein A